MTPVHQNQARRLGVRAAVVSFIVCGLATVAPTPGAEAPVASASVDRLVAAVLGETPLATDVTELSDRVGGRPTGSPQNERAIEWALARFRDAGVEARREPFPMRAGWLERSARARIAGPDVSFEARAAAMPYSTGTGPAGASGPLVDAGAGSAADFVKLGDRARGAFLLVTTRELEDIEGLFKEYADATAIEQRAAAAGAAGVVYMGSRPGNALYRHNVSAGPANTRPMIVIERAAAERALRLLGAGLPLTITEHLDIDARGPYESANVIGEIRGATRPDEVVVMGAHLDSWDLGDGTLDNGANVAMMIDIARQIVRLGLKPARTIRFALWNGEEMGILGSLGYTKTHADELDRHVLAGSVDIGCGRITGFFTGGRPEVASAVDAALKPVAGLGPFVQVDAPIVGTDNLDFMLEGVANVVANQEAALYGPNYHARTDTLDKCDRQQLRLNTAIVAAVTWAFADSSAPFPRQSRADIEALMRRTDLADQLKSMGMWVDWESGVRGRR